MTKKGSRKYDVKAIYKKAIKLLKENPEIAFDSVLFNCLGVGKTWFYTELICPKKHPNYANAIKSKIESNRGFGALDAIRDMNRSDAPACIISRAKMMDEEIRRALSTRTEPEDEEQEIPKITFGKQE